MQIIPTSKHEWSKLVLFPFKAYSVLGAVGAFVYIWLYSDRAYIVDKIMGLIWGGYVLSALALIVGGLVQKYAMKSREASSSIVFGIVDLGAVFFLPLFFVA